MPTRMGHSHAAVKLVMKAKNSDSPKISLVMLVFFNLSGQFLADKYISVQISI